MTSGTVDSGDCRPSSDSPVYMRLFLFFNLSLNVDLWHFTSQFSSVSQSCPALCDPMNCSTPGLPVHHHLPEFTQTHVHWVGDAIQPSHPLSSPSPPAFNLSQHQGVFKWVSSLHQVAKVLEFQLQHQSSNEYSELIFFKNGLVGSPCSSKASVLLDFISTCSSKGLPWWSGGWGSVLPVQGALISIPGQETKSHMLQLRPSSAK